MAWRESIYMKKGGDMDGEKDEGQRQEVLTVRDGYIAHELKEMHRKVKGTLLQLEALLRKLDSPVSR